MTEICLELKDIRKGFSEEEEVLKGISLSICERDFIAIMGPSGSGKTTLLNLLSNYCRA